MEKLLSEYPILYPLPLVSVVHKRVYVCVYTCVGQRTQKCNWIHIYIDLHIYIHLHLNLHVHIYVCIYISIHTYILEQGRWLGWYRWPPASQPSPMISYGDCQMRITRPFGCPLLTCAFLCDASNAWCLDSAAFFREVRKKRTMTHGPIWSQKW